MAKLEGILIEMDGEFIDGSDTEAIMNMSDKFPEPVRSPESDRLVDHVSIQHWGCYACNGFVVLPTRLLRNQSWNEKLILDNAILVPDYNPGRSNAYIVNPRLAR